MKKWLKAIIVIIASGISGCLYRAGGSGNYPRQARIIGVSALSVLVLALLTWKMSLWLGLAYFLSFGLSCGAVSAYWNKKDADETFINYYLHGLGIALAFLPYSIVTQHWLGFCLRLLILPLVVAFWTVKANKFSKHADIWSEVGRGVIITLSIPLLLI